MGRLRQTGLNALAGLAAAAVVAILFAAGALDRLEHVSWAWRARLFSDERAAPVPVRLILLDQESLAWAARENGLSWPWPREVYAPLIEWCDAAGAKALFLDVLFTEPSAYGVDDDRALGRALAGSGRTVAAMMAGARGGPTARRPAGVPAVFTFADPAPPPGGRALYPVPDVATNAFCLASVRAEPDSDDVLRRIPLWEAFDGAPIPSPAAALPAAAGELQPVVSSDDGTARVGDRSIPLDRDGLALLRYFGGIERYRPVRAAAVIRSGLMRREGAEPELDPDEFRDAYVLFGFSAPGLKDLRSTPLGGLMPGVGIHAIALENLLRNAFIRPLPPGGALLWILFCGGAAGAALGAASRPSATAAIAPAALVLPAAVSAAGYAAGWNVPAAAPALAAAGAVLASTLVQYALEGRRKGEIKRAFRHYLSPAVIERLLDDPSRLQLGGERKELTLFFSDLQGFTTFSEQLDPETLTSLLNDYLSAMTDVLLDEGGTVDKYEGDAIIAFWNAPLDQPDHAARACRAAVRCRDALAGLRGKYVRRYGADLRMRIGLHTGEAVVGNMGSRERFDYTALGDAVNLASRLEGANKAFGTGLLASSAVRDRAGKSFRWRRIGPVQVAGRSQPVDTWQLLADCDPPVPDAYERGLRECDARRWIAAIEAFETCPDDPVAERYARRLRDVASNGAPWDGTWVLEDKG
jgi:adenylate cyclase